MPCGLKSFQTRSNFHFETRDGLLFLWSPEISRWVGKVKANVSPLLLTETPAATRVLSFLPLQKKKRKELSDVSLSIFPYELWPFPKWDTFLHVCLQFSRRHHLRVNNFNDDSPGIKNFIMKLSIILYDVKYVWHLRVSSEWTSGERPFGSEGHEEG